MRLPPQTNKFSWENDDKSSDLDRFGVTIFRQPQISDSFVL